MEKISSELDDKELLASRVDDVRGLVDLERGSLVLAICAVLGFPLFSSSLELDTLVGDSGITLDDIFEDFAHHRGWRIVTLFDLDRRVIQECRTIRDGEYAEHTTRRLRLLGFEFELTRVEYPRDDELDDEFFFSARYPDGHTVCGQIFF